jgi:hypothetical protein
MVLTNMSQWVPIMSRVPIVRTCVSQLPPALWQINHNGYRQQRNIAIDPMRGTLLNFTKRMRLVKTLPLSQLVQIEKSACNTCLLCLVFTSAGERVHSHCMHVCALSVMPACQSTH